MDEITALAKRRGFIFQSSEIYGGVNGMWDYGPVGTELKRNLREAWWRDMVTLRDDVVGIETSVIMHPEVWRASGHVDNFTDMMVDCKTCKKRWRADHLTSDQCPACGNKTLTAPRAFNLMFKTSIGAMEDASSEAYLRPETAQGMFVDFKLAYQAARKRPPFGIAQIGKAFRNEITPGNFIFRSREFELMEMEFFVPPQPEDEGMKWYRYWVERRYQWWLSLGVQAERLRKHEYSAPTSRITAARRPTSSTTTRSVGANWRALRTAARSTWTSTSKRAAKTFRSSTKRARRNSCPPW